jgi:hypothetical protein
MNQSQSYLSRIPRKIERNAIAFFTRLYTVLQGYFKLITPDQQTQLGRQFISRNCLLSLLSPKERLSYTQRSLDIELTNSETSLLVGLTLDYLRKP